MKKFNIGIIGYGWAASAHIDAINNTGLGQVTAVYSSRLLDSDEVSAAHGGRIKTYTDLKSMLKDPSIDVVDVTSYPYQHADQVVAAARAGKHLIIEKPLCLSKKDLRRMLAAVKKARVKTCVCFECRFSGEFLTLKAVIDKGLVGKIHYGEVDYYHGVGPWYGQYRWNTKKDAGGSSLLSAGCHALDALLYCMGSTDVVEVVSHSTKSKNRIFQKYEYDTTAVTILKFKDGRLGKVASVIDCLQPYYFHTHLVGSEGSILDNKFYSSQLGGLNKNVWSELGTPLVDSGDVADHPYQQQFEVFFKSLRAGKKMPHTTLEESAKSHEIIFAADQSAATGKPVKIR
ncbi:MAG: 4,5-dihydroxyphthalate dehydrogenase [Verrucomicrobiales bacterium]|nr:4,5-dihydroxyphthalate dehydrogenase [Verrucomicrobiales bacterium]